MNVNAILDSHADDEEHLLNVYTVGEQEAAIMRESEHERMDRVDNEGREKVDLVIKLLGRSGGLKRFSRTFLSISVYDFISLRIIAEVMTSSNATNILKSISVLFLFGSIALLAGLTFHHKKVYMHYKLRERAAIWVGMVSTSVSFLSIMYVGLYPAILAASLGPQLQEGCHWAFCYPR